MVKSTLERQEMLRKRRKKLGQTRREYFLTDLEHALMQKHLKYLRRFERPDTGNQSTESRK